VAAADSYEVRGALQVLAARGVLANDSDADGNRLAAILRSGPAHGTLKLNSDGGFVYTPAVGYAGRDSFSYAASDGTSQSAPATVSLQVSPAPDTTPPVVALAGGARRQERALAPARGSAEDVYVLPARGLVVSSGLKSVVLNLQRADGAYWNGRAYQRAPFALRTQMRSRSFFSPATALPVGAQAPDGRYTWTAIATDNAGNSTRAQQSVTVDSVPPSVLITTPQGGADNAARLTRLASVAGRASGATRVEVAFRRADGLFWNGTSYQIAPAFRVAALQNGAWSLASGWPAGADLPPASYILLVRAHDEAGNVFLTSRAIVVASGAAG
jgi:hypothetical protein